MTIHLSDNWKITDGIENAPIEDIGNAVVAHGYQAPMCYAILSDADRFVCFIGSFLSRFEKPLTKENL